jgi:hypothetical protein
MARQGYYFYFLYALRSPNRRSTLSALRSTLTYGCRPKWLESFWFIWVLDSHLSTYGNLCLARFASLFPCSFVMNVRRLRMAPSCVVVGQLASQYGVEWPMCICGVASGFSLVVPSFARSSAITFPVMPVRARTLCMWILCGVQYICRTIAAMSNLSGW